MQVDKKIDKQKIELTVRVTKTDVQKILEHTAEEINKKNPIPGFRPGKLPYNLAVSKYGEDLIVREALDEIVQETLNQAIVNEDLRFYGDFDFELLSVLKDNWLIEYKSSATIMPEVKLGNWQDQKIKRTAVLVSNEELDKALQELAGMRKHETKVEREVRKGDKAVLDLEVWVDGKIIDGGNAKEFEVTVGEGRMIPGFEDKLLGHKGGENFEFELAFPADYHEGSLSGKSALFKIKLNEVDEVTLPEINDEFAKTLGMENAQALKDRIGQNLAEDKQHQQEDKIEIEAIKQVVDAAAIGELPDKMVEDATLDALHDFEHSLSHDGLAIEQYLASTKKTIEQVKADIKPKAIEKIKTTLVLNKLAAEEKLKVEETEVDEELAAQKKYYASRPEILNDLNQPAYRDHLRRTLFNRKVVKFIKSKIVEA